MDMSNNGRRYGSIDRSKIKFLLGVRDTENCQQVSTLLTKCCYQGV